MKLRGIKRNIWLYTLSVKPPKYYVLSNWEQGGKSTECKWDNMKPGCVEKGPKWHLPNRLELNFELSRFCYCCNTVCHVVIAMKCMRAQVTWQKLVIGSPYWNTVVIVDEFSFLVCTVLFALPAFGLTLLLPLYTRTTFLVPWPGLEHGLLRTTTLDVMSNSPFSQEHIQGNLQGESSS